MRKQRVDRTSLRRDISALLGRLAFSQTAIHICEQEGSAAREEFLLCVLISEMANREEVRRARFLREAGFRIYKTLAGYDFQSLRLPPNLSRTEPSSGAFIAEKKNLVLYGPVGTGKTHLASALGVLACEQGIRTRFFTAAQLVVRLSEAFSNGSLEKVLSSILKAQLLIIDSGRGPGLCSLHARSDEGGLARGSTSAVLARGYKSRASGEPKARPLTNGATCRSISKARISCSGSSPTATKGGVSSSPRTSSFPNGARCSPTTKWPRR